MKAAGRRRTIGLAVAAGVVVAFSTILLSLRQAENTDPDTGSQLPPLELITLVGEPVRLDQWARGMEEVLVITSTCDDCTAFLRTRLQVYAQRPGDFPARMERSLLLLIRTQGLARAAFMEAFEGARELGARVLLITPDQALALGVTLVPTRIGLDDQGRILDRRGPVELLGLNPPE